MSTGLVYTQRLAQSVNDDGQVNATVPANTVWIVTCITCVHVGSSLSDLVNVGINGLGPAFAWQPPAAGQTFIAWTGRLALKSGETLYIDTNASSFVVFVTGYSFAD